MTTTIPVAVIHGITSRLENRITDDQSDRIKSLLSGEHDLSRALTFVVPGYSGIEFHVMIRQVAPPDGKFTPQWQCAILVCTKTIKFIYDEPLAASFTVAPEKN